MCGRVSGRGCEIFVAVNYNLLISFVTNYNSSVTKSHHLRDELLLAAFAATAPYGSERRAAVQPLGQRKLKVGRSEPLHGGGRGGRHAVRCVVTAGGKLGFHLLQPAKMRNNEIAATTNAHKDVVAASSCCIFSSLLRNFSSRARTWGW